MGQQEETSGPVGPTFAVGDVVRCVDAFAAIGLKRGSPYIINATHDTEDGLQMVELRGRIGWRQARRFEFVHPATPEDTLATATTDPTIQPSHYTDLEMEPIRVGVLNYGRGILVTKIHKYTARAHNKNGLQDLNKAARCLRMLAKFDAGDADWWKVDSRPLELI
jgi:hypothetical protein